MKNPLYHWRIRRTEAPIRAKQVAEDLRVTPQAVWLWERGEVRPRKRYWKAIAKLLDIKVPILIRRWSKWHESLGNAKEAAELLVLSEHFDLNKKRFVISGKKQRV